MNVPPRGLTPPVALRCRAANKGGTLGEARKHRGLAYIGVHALVRESGPHGIGVESLMAQLAVTSYKRVNPFATVLLARLCLNHEGKNDGTQEHEEAIRNYSSPLCGYGYRQPGTLGGRRSELDRENPDALGGLDFHEVISKYANIVTIHNGRHHYAG